MNESVPLADPMLSSARSLLSDAISAWIAKEHGKVLMFAPIAVEHLCKSALWNRNPVLLAPLDQNHERTFLALVTKPELADESIRTISLPVALARVAKVFDLPPALDNARTKRLVESRGGAVHVGQFTAENAEAVLSDVLSVFQWLTPIVGWSQQALFGHHSETAARLLDRRRSATHRSVDRRIAAARASFQRLVTSVGHDLLGETIAQKESLATAHVARLIEEVAVGTDRPCPACTNTGIIIGDLETDHDVDAEGGPDGIDYTVTTSYFLTPDSYYCNVCGLRLDSAEELEMCGLPSTSFQLSPDEVTPSLEEFARDRDAWLHESESMGYDGS